MWTFDIPSNLEFSIGGILTRPQTARLLNEIDIFVDFSSWQTMGLTAMEAMCCGAAVIAPQLGGVASFIKHEENGIIVDTTSLESCLAALERLINDAALRTRLQRQAVFDICQFFRERAAFNILKALFYEQGRDLAMVVGSVSGERPQLFRSGPSTMAGGKHATSTILSTGQEASDENIADNQDRVLQSFSADGHKLADVRARFVKQGKALWEGKRLLFILPVAERSGGANVVLDEAAAMSKMGLEINIVNLDRYRQRFDLNYFDNTLPVIFVS
jgi:hypothetical protein